jgi:hypothetical protein
MEWKLPGADDIRPDRPWMRLEGQPGFRQRAKMVADLVHLVAEVSPAVVAVTELGCGDGSLLGRFDLQSFVKRWGYEIGAGDVERACSRGLDVRQADILSDPLEYGDLLVVSEVLEHLADPVKFLMALPLEDGFLIASSPSEETGDWHNPIHSWAWDAGGYRELLERGGWRVLYQAECGGGFNTFGGVTRPQRFQACVAVR